MSKLHDAKKQYDTIDIPEELEQIVTQSIRSAKKERRKNTSFKKWSIGAVAASALFIGSVNISPALAQTLSSIPVLGQIVEVVTIQEIKIEKDSYHADLKTPSVTGLGDKELEDALNEKYIEENKQLYDQFIQEMGSKEEENFAVASDYEVTTNTEEILSITRYQSMSYGSTFISMRTDTIDKKNNLLITLPSLFKNDAYIEVISSYIKEEMIRQMKTDEDVVYWIANGEEAGFEAIRPDQTFAITADHKLSISFDKYEVAPGASGVITFEIPTEVIEAQLVSDYYIR